MPSDNEHSWREAASEFDQDWDIASEHLAKGHAVTYRMTIDGQDCLVKEYPNGRIEQLDDTVFDETRVIRVICH